MSLNLPPLSALSRSLLQILIGKPFLSYSLSAASSCVVYLLLASSSIHPSIPSYIYKGLSFSPLCALTGRFLSLLMMEVSVSLHSATDIFPTGDPTAAAAGPTIQKWTDSPPLSSLLPHPHFSGSISSAKLRRYSRGAFQQDWFVLEWLGPKSHRD